MGKCHLIRAARQNLTTTIGVEVGKAVAALERGVYALEGANADLHTFNDDTGTQVPPRAP